jgi:hypothetical protein
MAEQTGDMISALRALIQSEMMDINTSIDGVVVSYKDGLATVRPQATKLFADGDTLPFPDIPNVPIRWPSFNGGQCGIKGPVRAGDKVLVIFAQQAVDGTDDMRRFDLSDAYAIPAGNTISGQASDNESMVMWFGDAFIKLTDGGKLEINAPGGTSISGEATITGKTTMNGGFESTGSAINNGKDIGSGHRHSGVRAGGEVSGGVV